MAHSFYTRKNATGTFDWGITRTVWDETIGKGVTTTVIHGTEATRAKAAAIAKKWVVYYRKGGK